MWWIRCQIGRFRFPFPFPFPFRFVTIFSLIFVFNPLPNNAPPRASRLGFMAAPPRVLTVAHDGCADFRTVQEAIDTVPFSNTCRTIIRVSPGIYRQPLYVPKTKNFITFAGLNPETTILTWDNTATQINHHQVGFSCGFIISYLGLRLICRIVMFFSYICLWPGFSCHWNWDFWLWEYNCWRRGFYCWEYHVWEFFPSGTLLLLDIFDHFINYISNMEMELRVKTPL